MDKFIQSLAREAGERLYQYFQQEQRLISVRENNKEIVTRYDKVVSQYLVGQIEQRYPTHNILSEESGFRDKGSSYMWIVDALDGTQNFANNNPLFAVCLGIAKDEEMFLGVIYLPVLDELYFAEQGQGAFLEGRQLEVSSNNNLADSYGVWCEGGVTDRDKLTQLFSSIYPQVMDLRKLGSGGAETAWVASGRSDFYFVVDVEPWDIAPGVLLVEEAGGEVTDLQGHNWTLSSRDLLFSNGQFHDSLLKKINWS